MRKSDEEWKDKMTKADITDQIYKKVGFSRKESADIVEKVFEVMKESLESGENVKIARFGNFVVRKKKARVGRNPQTGETIEIARRKVLTFKASQILKGAVNSGES